MSEGIPELGAKEEDDASDEEDKVEEVQPDVEQIEIKSNKPKTRFLFFCYGNFFLNLIFTGFHNFFEQENR